MLTFTIPGNPAGKGRPRFTREGIVYTDAATKKYEELVKQRYKLEHGTKTISPVMVRIRAYHKIPKAWNAVSRAMAEKGAIVPTRKPDVDNIAKIILDALNGVAWRDDSQVVSLTVHKHYANEPCVTVQITPLSMEDTIE